jgi:hypothetical protein
MEEFGDDGGSEMSAAQEALKRGTVQNAAATQSV